MEIGFIIAIALAVPVILFPAAFIWYINVCGLVQVWKDRKSRELRLHRIKNQVS